MKRLLNASLGTQLFVLQMVIVLLTVVGTATVWVSHTRRQLDEQYEQRALAIAESVAGLPGVREAFDDPHPEATLQPIALSIQKATGADYVVIANKDQIRYAHPTASLIGQKLSTDGTEVLTTGEEWTGVQTGTLGTSVRGKAPIFDVNGQIIGLASVGILEQTVAAELADALPPLIWTVFGVLVLGSAAAAFITRRVRRQTFGLEPKEIAGLLEQREGVLHGVKEGVVALDLDGRMTLINDAAQELLGDVGGSLDDLPANDRLRDVMAGDDVGEDRIVLRHGRTLVLNRTPVEVRGQHRGWVVTLRDRTELIRLSHQLDEASNTTDMLRAQAHEFANRMHTVVGLLELGEEEMAVRYITESAGGQYATDIREQVKDPTLAALLLAKSAQAAERGAALRAGRRRVRRRGNARRPARRRSRGRQPGRQRPRRPRRPGRDGGGVRPHLGGGPARPGQRRRTRSGRRPGRRGVPGGLHHQGGPVGPRGLGLALTRQACLRRGGWVKVHNERGAVFTALLPRRSG